MKYSEDHLSSGFLAGFRDLVAPASSHTKYVFNISPFPLTYWQWEVCSVLWVVTYPLFDLTLSYRPFLHLFFSFLHSYTFSFTFFLEKRGVNIQMLLLPQLHFFSPSPVPICLSFLEIRKFSYRLFFHFSYFFASFLHFSVFYAGVENTLQRIRFGQKSISFQSLGIT